MRTLLTGIMAVALTLAAHAAEKMPPHAAFGELPLRQIKPAGWLAQWLRAQADGLTGHPEEHGAPFDRPVWDQPDPAQVKPYWDWYEQTGYWVDGAVRCGTLVGDAKLFNHAAGVIRFVLDNADADGYLGPKFLKKIKLDAATQPSRAQGVFDPEHLPPGALPTDARFNQWPHVVFFRSLMALHSATGDPRIIESLKRHYLESVIDWYCVQRNTANVEILLWLYGQTGDPRLLAMAQRLFAQFAQLNDDSCSVEQLRSSGMSFAHAVSFSELSKLGSIFYCYTEDKSLLEASINAIRKAERDHMLISGVYSSEEGLNGRGSVRTHETCDISDSTWSIGYLLMATGDAHYGDLIEKAIFNAGIGAVREDFRGFQYFSAPNQVIADRQSNHAPTNVGNQRMSYRPHHETPCCAGNVHRFMPNYAARMWMRSRDGGLVAALYGPSRVEIDGISITEETDYPFSDKITFRASAAVPREMSLHLRLPAWCEHPAIQVNGRPWDGPLKPGTFSEVRRTFANGDVIELSLPMQVRFSRWPEGGIGVDRGPLAYALRIKEDWQVDPADKAQSRDFPAWNLYAASPWNYAIDVDETSVSSIAVEQRPMGANPWTNAGAPIILRVPARAVNGWELKHLDSVVAERRTTKPGPFTWTPPLPDPADLARCLGADAKTIELIPYGCARLRISVFPSARAQFVQTVGDEFDGVGSLGWACRGAFLDERGGVATVRRMDAKSTLLRSGEALMDFSSPVVLSVKAEAAAGPWKIAITNESQQNYVFGSGPITRIDVLKTSGTGEHQVNLTEKLNWTGPHRFRIEIATPAVAGEQLKLDYVRLARGKP